ncbi:hypothetical protein VNI00_008474 [Paramarasmius palmivorus]|uniref:F-box domain-containing protein n=1 Tax=Paramarasmius palmivorus TaxID=297713 RepID=A0AAW0CVL7_9AGAR
MSTVAKEATLDTPVELCDKCHECFPVKSNPYIPIVESYLSQHPANHISLDHEIPSLGEALQECLAEVKGYDQELKRMLEATRRMTKRREYLWGMAKRLRGMITSSIRRLPPEILLHVFHLTWQQGGQWGCEQSKTRITLTLGQVCSHWRTLVHSTPQLWSDIKVEFRAKDSAKFARRVLRWNQFLLEKTRHNLLDIQFIVPEYPWETPLDFDTEYNTQTHQPVISELLRYGTRWQTADLTVMRDEVFTLPQDLPHLTTLTVLRRQVLEESFPEQIWIAESGPPSPLFAPRLSNLSLSAVEIRLAEPVNLDSLTCLMLDCYYMDTLLDILRYAPNLMDVHIAGPVMPRTSTSSGVVTSRLRTLEAKHLSSIPGFFRRLTLPCLSSLYISETSNASAIEEDNDFQLASFLSRSKPPLSNLTLKVKKSLAYEGLIHVLGMLPNVTSFTLGDRRYQWDIEPPFFVADDLLRHLTTTESDAILPNLTSLHIHFPNPPTSDRLRDMVHSRLQRPVDQRLKSLRLVFCYCSSSTLGQDIRECTEELRNAGVVVEVVCTHLPIAYFE